jgi:hypothetical protein
MTKVLVVLLALGVCSGCCDCENPAAPGVPTQTAAPTASPAPTAAPTAAANQPPELGIEVHPRNGTAPLTVLANMCFCADADRDALFYSFKWGDGQRGGSQFCRREHVYATPGQYRAIFCVSDHNNEDVCQSYVIRVQ